MRARSVLSRAVAATAVVAAFVAVEVVPAGATTFSNPASITIPESGAATPYPSDIAVSNLPSSITGVTVTLNDLSHSFIPDVDVAVRSPQGTVVLLMADAGGAGQGVSAIDVTFQDGATALPSSGPLTSGTYAPGHPALDTGEGNLGVTPFPDGPAGPYASTLGAFAGQNPNGTWSLFVVDDSGSDSGSIAGGWSLDITTVAPDPLVAVADTFTVVEDSVANDLDILANDDLTTNGTPPVQPLGTVNFAVTDPPHTVTSQGSPTHLVYSPAENFDGVYTITYSLRDGFGGESPTVDVDVTVTPVNDAPVGVDDNPSVAEGTPSVLDLLGNDEDVEGDGLEITGTSDPAHGTVVIAGDGSEVTYTPDDDFAGTDTFTYTVADDGVTGSPAVADPKTGTATVTVDVTNTNDAPVAVDDPGITTVAGHPVTFDVTANDTDADGDEVTAAVDEAPGHGTVACEPDGRCTYTPAAGFVGTDTFTYLLDDGAEVDAAAVSAPATVTIRVTAAQVAPTTTTRPPTGALPRTGSEPGPSVLMAIGLVLAGAGIVVLAQERRPRPAPVGSGRPRHARR